jgi:uncharacterized membrane protein
MEIKFTQSLSLERYMEFQRYYLKTRISMYQKFAYIFLLLIGILIIFFRIFSITDIFFHANIYIALVFILLPIYTLYNVFNKAKKQFKEKQHLFQNMEFIFTSEKIFVSISNNTKVEMPLSQLTSIEETQHLYLLFISKDNAYIVDKQQIPFEYAQEFTNILIKSKATKTVTDHLI